MSAEGVPRTQSPGQVQSHFSRVVSFIDIGTNSVRLLLVRINPNQSHTVLSRQKEVVRLGENEFTDRTLKGEAMDRAVLVVRKFVELSRSYSASEFVAVATSATREARNRAEFLQRLERGAGAVVHPISGKEEARLTYMGVVGGVHLEDRKALFIDIGGGSTEVVVGNGKSYEFLSSLALGALRLTNLFLHEHTGPVPPKKYQTIKQHVRYTAVEVTKRIRDGAPETALGSSGTIENLAEMAARMHHGRKMKRGDAVTLAQLKRLSSQLCALPLEERRAFPGMDPQRADTIIAGAAILEEMMQEAQVTTLTVSDRGLRDGLLADYLSRTEHGKLLAKMSVRERSVLQLGRACNFDEAHAGVVARLALELFDGARREGLHPYRERERELLRHAATLHDVGMFLSFDDHHAHSHYLITNADLVGFDQEEIELIGVIAYFHRKGFPRDDHRLLRDLDPKSRRMVQVLSTFLRIAKSLNRSRTGVIRQVRVRASGPGELLLLLQAAGDCELELWGLRNQADSVKRAFGRRLEVAAARAVRPGPAPNSRT